MGLGRVKSTLAEAPDRLRPIPGVGPIVKFRENSDRNFVPNFLLVDTGPTPLLVLCERSPMLDEHRATSNDRDVDGEEKYDEISTEKQSRESRILRKTF